ncbi:hypothetical protein D3C80_2117430 [compost metagenome]
MKKNNHNKESINLHETGDLSTWIGAIPNPIPEWMRDYFKSYSYQFPVNINENLVEGYPVDDDF